MTVMTIMRFLSNCDVYSHKRPHLQPSVCRMQCHCEKLLAASPLCCKQPQHGSQRRYRRGRGSCAYPCPGSRLGKERGWRKACCDSGGSSGYKAPCCHPADKFNVCESGCCWLSWRAGRGWVGGCICSCLGAQVKG